MKIRVDKYLSDMGIGTRTEIKNHIKKRAVTINGMVVKAPSDKADTDNDIVSFMGKDIPYVIYEYYVLNKPSGVVSATEDKSDKTVIELIVDRKRTDLFPVGRLDKDTEGLLIITNDGMFAHNLLSPKKHVDKTYYVETDGFLKEEYIDLFTKGIELSEDFTTLPSKLEIIEASENGSKAYLTIREGKFHQVKRMMEAVNNTVTYLKRIRMGSLTLPLELEAGEYRKLTDKEISDLKGI